MTAATLVRPSPTIPEQLLTQQIACMSRRLETALKSLNQPHGPAEVTLPFPDAFQHPAVVAAIQAQLDAAGYTWKSDQEPAERWRAGNYNGHPERTVLTIYR